MKALCQRRNLKAAVYERLKESIIRGKIPPGFRLAETPLAQRLGVSRTPLREAINRLEQEGLVEIFPRRGAFVKNPSLPEILETLELREVLEGLAGKLAARQAPPAMIEEMKKCFHGFTPGNVEHSLAVYAARNVRFHHLIIQASQNRKLIALICNLYDQMDMVRLHTILLPGRAKRSLAEHRQIIRLIERRQGHRLEKFLRSHIRGLKKAVLRLPDVDFDSSRPASGEGRPPGAARPFAELIFPLTPSKGER